MSTVTVNKSRVRSALTTLKKSGFIISANISDDSAVLMMQVPIELTMKKPKAKRKK